MKAALVAVFVVGVAAGYAWRTAADHRREMIYPPCDCAAEPSEDCEDGN